MTSWAHLVWYVDRAAGYTALVLLTASILLGLLLSLKVASPRWPRFLTNDVHEHITLMALVFIAIHGVAILIDPFMRFGWGDVLVPFGSAYHPLAMALGIVAGYLALAIWLSSRVRKQIGFRMWRRLHYATFLVYAFAGVHTLLIGNDRSTTLGSRRGGGERGPGGGADRDPAHHLGAGNGRPRWPADRDLGAASPGGARSRAQPDRLWVECGGRPWGVAFSERAAGVGFEPTDEVAPRLRFSRCVVLGEIPGASVTPQSATRGEPSPDRAGRAGCWSRRSSADGTATARSRSCVR